MNTVSNIPMYGWNMIPWKKVQRNVFKLQKRIYRASCRGDVKTVRQLQRLLMKSKSTKLLAVRKVTQDNQGKKTAGVDGVKSLTPPQRLALADTLKIGRQSLPVRRVWIEKAGGTDKRPLGIPVMRDRALQSLVQIALEAEWEARFEPNSYGFRPGRSCHDAIGAIYLSINQKPKYVLDTDVEKCFDKIRHAELLKKINTYPSLRRQIKAWLKAGVLDDGKMFPTEAGTMQGGPVSPLLANVALHGIEQIIVEKFPRQAAKRFYTPNVVRFADDLVVLHDDLETIQQCREMIDEHLAPMGLRLKPSKTRRTHTLKAVDGKPGFDFLGFNIRQYPVGKTKSGKNSRGDALGFKTLIKPSSTGVQRHTRRLRETVDHHKQSDQAELITTLNPIIIGWTNYYATAVSGKVFEKLGRILLLMLLTWASRRHPNKSKNWIVHKYWSFTEGKRWIFRTPDGKHQLYRHAQTSIRRHVKVKDNRSPYDGAWVYWSTRLGRHPEVAVRVSKLLKKQRGVCRECGLVLMDGDVMEVDH